VKITKDQKAVAESSRWLFRCYCDQYTSATGVRTDGADQRQSCSDKVRGHPSRTFGTWSRPLASGTKAWKVLPPAALSSVFNGPSCVGAYAAGLAGLPGGSQRSARTRESSRLNQAAEILDRSGADDPPGDLAVRGHHERAGKGAHGNEVVEFRRDKVTWVIQVTVPPGGREGCSRSH
jgi:hypothetical protein